MSPAIRDERTTPSAIYISWLPIAEPTNGNSDVTSYSVEFDAGSFGQEWFVLTGYLTDFTQTSLVVTE